MKTGRYTIDELFQSTEIEQIIVPEIQRDYVWRKDNVERLLNSIISNFNRKQATVLDIKLNGEEIDGEIAKFLSREYEKLKFNTRIGFIYAYHSPEFAGKYFLIDGQQRLTTIFLMIMAAYHHCGLFDSFLKKYFKDRQPKIDYQVRETSHDFLVNFIEFLGKDNASSDFSADGEKFYEIYEKDTTASSMTRNFALIYNKIKAEGIVAVDLIDYLEHYIEFNYFDTNITDQGERLYLYMNSRGESLTDQELVKSVVVSRSPNKTNAGRLWEDWQNFFWRHRGKNPNADAGFLEFLKWAVILHLKTSDAPKLKPAAAKQTQIELREDYIKRTDAVKKEQPFWIRAYIRENDDFNAQWLESMMKAVEFLEKKRNEDADMATYGYFIHPDWLSDIKSVIDYLPILACMLYMHLFPDYTEENVERLGMYAKNLEFGYDNRRNPDRAVLRVIDMVLSMKRYNVADVRNLKECEDIKDFNVLNRADLRFVFVQGMGAEAWEEYFWDIIRDARLNHFLRGNANGIIRLFQDMPTLRNARQWLDDFKSKIFRRIDQDSLREELLRIKDVSLYEGTSNMGMEKWSMLCVDSDYNDWNKFLGKASSTKVLKKCISGQIPEYDGDYRQALGRSLGYAELKKFLWLENSIKGGQPHIIILKKFQTSEYNSRELPLNILHQELDKKGTFVNYKHLRLAYEDIYLHVYFNYIETGSEWKIKVSSKDDAGIDAALLSKIKGLLGTSWEEVIEDGQVVAIKYLEPIAKDAAKEPFLAGCNRAKAWIESFLKNI